MTVEYKLISTETGEILSTNLISETREDEVWYITYDANSKNLLSHLSETTSVDHYAKILHRRKLFYLLFFFVVKSQIF